MSSPMQTGAKSCLAVLLDERVTTAHRADALARYLDRWILEGEAAGLGELGCVGLGFIKLVAVASVNGQDRAVAAVQTALGALPDWRGN